MKRLLLCGAVTLSLVGLMLVAYRDGRDNGNVVRYDDREDDGRYYHRGPIRYTADVVEGTGRFAGDTLKGILGVRDGHRGFYDSEGNYHR